MASFPAPKNERRQVYQATAAVRWRGDGELVSASWHAEAGRLGKAGVVGDLSVVGESAANIPPFDGC